MSQICRFLTCLIIFIAVAEDISARTCRIVFLNRPASAPKKLYLFDGTEVREVELPRMNLSPVYKLPDGNLNLRFFLTPPTDLENIPQGAPSVKMPEATKDLYLLITSNPENKVAPIRIQSVSADATQLSRGQMLWFNLTEKRVGGKVGSEKIDMKPHSRERVSEPRQGGGDYPVELYFTIKGDKHVHPLCESRWRHDPRSRSLVFIANDGKRRAPIIFSFSDFRLPEKKKEE
jgi:hypothetical protein